MVAEQSIPKRETERDRQREHTIETVLEAATGLFTTRGFEGTSLSVISKKAEVAVPLIVYHFGSKLKLWEAMVGRIYDRVDTIVAEYMRPAEELSGLDKLRRGVRAYMSATVKCPEYTRLLLKEGTETTPRLQWLVETYQRPMSERIAALIAEAQQENLLPPGDPMHLKYIWSGALGLAVALGPEYRLLDGVDVTDEAFIDRHVNLCLSLLTGQAAPQ